MYNYKAIALDSEIAIFRKSDEPGVTNRMDAFPIDYEFIADAFKLTHKDDAGQAADSSEFNMFDYVNRIGYVDINNDTFTACNDDTDIFIKYKLWQTRPERAVGKPVDVVGKSMEEIIEIYEELFIGATIFTNKCTVETNVRTRYSIAIDWLRTTDFYTAPASTRYHESFPGGLLLHSLNVYNKMIELSKIDTFKNVDIAQATICCLTHDWCKIGYYESFEKNVKNEKTGQWEKVPAYKVNQKGLPFGHGATSLYIVMKLLKLSDEQALAIRWHQGRWNVCECEQNEFQKANSSFPMVYLIQFADQLACTEY